MFEIPKPNSTPVQILSDFKRSAAPRAFTARTALAALASAMSLSSTLVQAQAEASQPLPGIVVQKPKRKPHLVQPATAARATPAEATVASTPRTPDLATPANTATLSGEAISDRELATSDSAALVNDIPGGAVWGAGGVSSLPALNGMGADRVQVAINSMLISPACPNEMNPPLSFVNPSMIASMRAYLGVAPVSAGGDYTGGKIIVETAPPKFPLESQGWVSSAMLSGFFRSNNNSYGVDASASIANHDTSISYTGGWVRAGDYHAADGTTVKSTLYETQNHTLTISKQTFGNLFSVQVGGQFIPYQGYVNQYMDMVYNRGLFVNGRYEGAFDWGTVEASAFAHQIRHTMGFIAPDKVGQMPMDTKGSDAGYSFKATVAASARDVVRFGNELYHNQLRDWWDPVAGSMMMSPNAFVSLNDGTRNRLGTFAEWDHKWSREWTTLIGLRNDVVWMNTGNVQGYNMMYAADAAAFNALDHARTDVNLDGSALVRYEPDQLSVFELGFARKTRSPNLYERYAWSTNMMAMNMIGWFGDGNGYVGNIDLKPEKAHTASITAGWHDAAQKDWDIKITPYYTYVQDYIDVDRCFTAATSMSCGAMNLTERNDFVYLRFANHDATLYGVNLSGKVALWDNESYGRGVFRAALSYTRGQRTDGIDLYHVMPVNAKLGLDHTLGNWTNSVELQLVGPKDFVSLVRNELTTPSYALVNVRTGYQWQQVRIDLGIDNLFNEYYVLPLGGADLTDYKGAAGTLYGFNVPGPGRSFNGRLTVQF